MWGAARRLTLTQRVVAIVAVATLPATAALPFFIASIHRERAGEVRDQALRTSQIVSLEMERIVTGAEGVLQTVALVPAVRAGDRTATPISARSTNACRSSSASPSPTRRGGCVAPRT